MLAAAVSEATADLPPPAGGRRALEVVVVGIERGGVVETKVRAWSGPLRSQRTAALDAAIRGALPLDEPTAILVEKE